MWRGTSLQGVPGPFAQAERERLTGLRLSTVEDYARLMTELGHYDIVVQELSPVVRDHPLRESAHALMMTALERSGHRDEALRLYDRIDHRLREELAVPPRAALRELYRRLREGGVVQGAAPAAQGPRPARPGYFRGPRPNAPRRRAAGAARDQPCAICRRGPGGSWAARERWPP